MGEFKRNIYLSMKTLDEARSIWVEKTGHLRTEPEAVPSTDALGRVTAGPVAASRSVPHYHGAAMDGFAVKARDTFGASVTNPLFLRMGEQVFPVDTGDALPPEGDAVIMAEHVHEVSETQVEIRSAVFPWQHVRKVGEDIVAGEMLLPQNHRLRPADLGALLAGGVPRVAVQALPKVWIQPTGSELLPPDAAGEMKPGEIIEFNGTVLAALVRENGGEPFLQATIPDEYASIQKMMEEAVASQADVILVNAGSSAGSEDYTSTVMNEMGEVWVHGVAMMPGKPTILGMVRGKPVLGIPGYPVSAILSFEQFVRPLLHTLQGLPSPSFPSVPAVLGRKLPSRLGMEEFVRVILGRVQGRLIAMPLQRGAGVITSLTRADGILQVPQELEGINEGEEVPVRLLRPGDQLDDTLIMIGSHDNTLDLLANELKRLDSRLHLSSSNVGSLGGLMAIRRGQTHLSGSHLLDTETGEYNFSYVERYLPGTSVRLVQLARRQQGFLVKEGNPKSVKTIDDLAKPGVTFINRQGGSGTRILTDYCLHKRGLSPEEIRGYDQEEFTHMAVAVNVLSGRADTGMAIYAAAKALGLDFIPVAEERYDLVVPEFAWNDRKLKVLMDVLQSSPFKKSVQDLGGYDVAECGKLMGIWDGQEWSERVP